MTDPITIIGANTVVSGNLEGDEDLTVEGRVEGSVTLSRTLTIEMNGVVHANINVRNAIISGVLVGNIEAQDSVHLTEEGRVVGDIISPRVILVDGSSFRGNIDMGDFDVERGEAGSTATTAKARAAAAYTPRETESRPRAEEAAPAKRPAPAPAKRPSAAPAKRPAPAKTKTEAKPTKRRRPPAPSVRSVGKSKAKKKRR